MQSLGDGRTPGAGCGCGGCVLPAAVGPGAAAPGSAHVGLAGHYGMYQGHQGWGPGWLAASHLGAATGARARERVSIATAATHSPSWM